MLERLFRRESLFRVEREHGSEQIDAVVTQEWERSAPPTQGFAHFRGQAAFCLARLFVRGDVVAQRRDAGPDFFSWGAEVVADDGELLDVRVGGKEEVADGEFGDYAGYAPHVDGTRVVVAAVEEFGRPVEACYDVGCHGPTGVGEGAGETEICEFDGAVGGDK